MRNTPRTLLQQCIIRVEKMPSPLTSPPGGSVAMGNCADLWARHRTRWLSAALLAIASFVSVPLAANAQETAIINRGDAAVTAFSGARQVGDVPPDLHPLDLTFIDTNGAALRSST